MQPAREAALTVRRHHRSQIGVFTTGVRSMFVDRVRSEAARIFGKEVDLDDDTQCFALLTDRSYTFEHVLSSSSSSPSLNAEQS